MNPPYRSAGLVFLISLGVYISTLCPSVYYGDSAEWQTVSYIFGLPHNTGYPLYITLGKLFTLLPFKNIAWRVNLMSAFFAALAAAFAYGVLWRLTKDSWVSASGALLFAFTETFWSQAIVAEVYTLNAFFIAAVLYCLLTWKENREIRWLYGAAALYAFSFGNHLTTITLLPALLLFIFLVSPKALFSLHNLVIVSLLVALAASMYIYLPLRSFKKPLFDWPREWSAWTQTKGELYKWKDFHSYVTGGRFKQRMLLLPEHKTKETPEERQTKIIKFFTKKLVNYHSWLRHQYTLLALITAFLGALGMLFTHFRTFLLFTLIALGNLAFSLTYEIVDIYVYYIPSYMMLVFFIAYAVFGIKKFLLIPIGREIKENSSLARALRTVVILGVVALPLTALAANYHDVDMSGENSADELARTFLEGCDENAMVVIGGWSWDSALRYMQYCEGVRGDVNIVWAFRDQWPRTIAKYFAEHPVYTLEEHSYLKGKATTQREELFGNLGTYIEKIPKGKIVVLAADDAVSRNLSAPDVAAIKSLGGKVDLRGKSRYSHALIGVRGAKAGTALEASDKEKVSLWTFFGEDIGKTEISSPAIIWVSSSGIEYRNSGYILVNGRDVSVGGQGYHIVVLNPRSGEVEDSVCFNTYDPPARVRITGLYYEGVYYASKSLGRKGITQYALEEKVIDLSSASARKYLIDGWSKAESWGAWAQGTEAKISFHLKETGDYLITVKYRGPEEINIEPAFRIYLNSQLLAEPSVAAEGSYSLVFDVPEEVLTGQVETLRFKFYPLESKDDKEKKDRGTPNAAIGVETIEITKK